MNTKQRKGALKLRDKNQTDDEFLRKLCLVTGTSTETGAGLALNQMASMQVWNRSKKAPERVLAAVDIIAEFVPRTATEAMLPVQMFGLHEAALLLLVSGMGWGLGLGMPVSAGPGFKAP